MYKAANNRYQNMPYRTLGASGLKVSAISLGLWHNFGENNDFENMREMVYTAFDCGITVFDLAANYGPPSGAAERNFGKILKEGFNNYRDEIIITTKAGAYNWDGPYGSGGSKKQMVAALDKSLKNLGLDYVDIFYSHIFDANTPLDETMSALSEIVKSGKALYVGISNYNSEQSLNAANALRELGTGLLVNQARYSMIDRAIETDNLFETAKKCGFGITVYSPLEQGILAGRYIDKIPKDSRMSINSRLKDRYDDALDKKVKLLEKIAAARGQTMSQLSLSYVLKGDVSSAIIGASSAAQIKQNININSIFTQAELDEIDKIIKL